MNDRFNGESLKSDECVFIRYVQNIKDAAALTPEDTINRGLFQSTRDVIPLEQRVYSDCPHSIAILIVAMYVDNNGCRTNAPALVHEFLAEPTRTNRVCRSAFHVPAARVCPLFLLP